MHIRAARPHDMTAVAGISRELAAHVGDPDPGYETAELIRCGFGPDQWFECIVAEEGDRIIGFALFCRRFEAHTRERRLWIGDLCVTGTQRGRGVGRALMGAVQARAQRLGCTAIDLDLAGGNDGARSFYENLKASRDDRIDPWKLSV